MRTGNKQFAHGEVLSPLLRNIVLDRVIHRLNNVLCDRMQTALYSIETCCIEQPLSIKPNNTEIVLFTKKRKIEGVMTPSRLHNNKLSFAEEDKYLGVTSGNRLRWILHIYKTVKKLTYFMDNTTVP